jgi:ATP-dependent Clp protease adaptor protein ClpS
MAERRRDEQEGGVGTAVRPKVEQPPKWKVLFHNDNYTSMEFVVFVLQEVFRHTPASATRIMLHIHKSGIGVAGVYSREVAETRVDKSLELAREHGHPLQVTMEPE